MSKDKEKELLAFLYTVEKMIPTSTHAPTAYERQLKYLIRYLEKDLQPIKVRSAKNKGMKLQQQACQMISTASGIPYIQGSDDSPIQSRPSGQHGTDVILDKEARKAFPFSIECKKTESFSLPTVIEQAKANMKQGDDWMIIHANSKIKKPVVIMEFEAFLNHYFKKKDICDVD